MSAKINKVLIANRGEIAVRIMRTLREMDIASVAVYADPDRNAMHAEFADEAYWLEGETAGETYLDINRLIDVARRAGAEAVHPGYGFLSENAAFARACDAAGIVFIGPTPDAIEAMGDKIVAKATMEQAGVPVVPGYTVGPDDSPAALAAGAARVGYPLLVKATAGGGGKGMRVVDEADALVPACEAARREAQAAFGDGRVFLERYLPRARHVEFQIFGDAHGAVTHLYERECSIQRRHQKIVEEAPSPALNESLRQRMADAAVRAAAAIGYRSAGTVEFLVDGDDFFFLEVNTRLQVEHPVTEMTLGRDLVRDQIVVASGGALPVTAEGVAPSGHAVECRIYAEDCANGFLPATGTIRLFEPPLGPGVRVDTGVRAGSIVSMHYDPMLAKLVTWSTDRAGAIERMRQALREFVVMGVTTNITFLRHVMEHAAFRAGDLHTRFLEEHEIAATIPPPTEARIVAAYAAMSKGPSATGGTGGPARATDPWRAAGHWRGGPS